MYSSITFSLMTLKFYHLATFDNLANMVLWSISVFFNLIIFLRAYALETKSFSSFLSVSVVLRSTLRLPEVVFCGELPSVVANLMLEG